MFYLDLSSRIDDALTRVDKLETLLRAQLKQDPSWDKGPQHVLYSRKRERRDANPTLAISELTRKVRSLERR